MAGISHFGSPYNVKSLMLCGNRKVYNGFVGVSGNPSVNVDIK